MKLWLLQDAVTEPSQGNPWEPWYDKAFGFVIRAETEVEARKLASEAHGNEGPQAWLDESQSSCEELSADGSADVILRDFSAA